MSDGAVFRTAQTAEHAPSETPTISAERPPILAEKVEGKGLYVHEALKGHPYTAEHFGLKLHWDSPTSEMKDQIKSVDEWVIGKAKERNLADSPDSYNEVINGILKQIGKSENESKQSQFERISNAIEAYKRLEMAKLPPILDVKSMTPNEYKKTRA